jgi:3-oxoacyl-[acyl-carrier protein] reductase
MLGAQFDGSKMRDLDFTGKAVLVVGGSSGIGNGIARSFLKRGALVHVWGTRESSADYRAEEGSDMRGLHYSKVDIADPIAVSAWKAPFSSLDVLVQSQGIVVYRRGEFEQEGWDRVMSVNLDSLMTVSRAMQQFLVEGGGSMIIVSSVSGFQANIGNPAYSASKAGAISLTRVLGKAWASQGIRVNGIAPGLVDTKLTKVTTANPDRLALTLASVPVGRIGQPSDMGNVALFLASPLASYITGQTIIVDGGLTLT